MIAFLTSSPDGMAPGEGPEGPRAFSNANGFAARLAEVWPRGAECLLICAEPDRFRQNTEMGEHLAESLAMSGLELSRLTVCDDRNANRLPGLIRESQVVVLSGGHTLTQNRFFRRIGLKRHILEFDGLLLGISGGSMNCAEVVYAQPEWSGDLSDPAYERFPRGLGLTDLMILPHYQRLKAQTLDGRRLIEDVAVPDSRGRTFYGLPDGSYVLLENGGCEIRGPVYIIRDGEITYRDAE